MSMSYLQFLRFKYGLFYKSDILRSWCSQDTPEIDERVIPMLIKWVKDRSFCFFAESAWLLGKIRDRRAVEPLISYLLESTESTHGYERCHWEAAIAALVKIGDQSGTEALAAVASKTSLSLSVRTLAAEGLCALGDERGIPVLVEELDSEERCSRDTAYWWRKEAAEGYVYFSSEIESETRKIIEQSRESKDPAVRAALQSHEAAENAKKEKGRQESIERERMLDKAEREGIPIRVECEYHSRKLHKPIPGHPEIPVCSDYCIVNPKTSESRTVLVTTPETSGKIAWYCEYCDRIFCGNCTYVPGSLFHHCPDMDCWATHPKPLVRVTVNHLRVRRWVPIKLV